VKLERGEATRREATRRDEVISRGEATESDGATSAEALEARFDISEPIDLRLTLGPIAHGPADPTIGFGTNEVWLARRTDSGPATIRIFAEPGRTAIGAQSWGPGAAAALDAVPGLAGLLDDPTPLVAHHPLVRELQRRLVGLRLPRTGQLLPALIAAVTEQKVTAVEAHRAYAALVRRLGEAAPGPGALFIPPAGGTVAALPYFEFHPMGLERRRAEMLRHIGRREAELVELLRMSPAEARNRLTAWPGLGPWTAAEATRAAFGDPDAVSLGDAHLPDLISWALTGEPRGNDARMLELLAPYEGQRGRVVRLIQASGIKIPRFGPRFAPRRIERL
jgi:3-methyladenine DNA glycosylase/8-oxoguanine DNA glycosylase